MSAGYCAGMVDITLATVAQPASSTLELERTGPICSGIFEDQGVLISGQDAAEVFDGGCESLVQLDFGAPTQDALRL